MPLFELEFTKYPSIVSVIPLHKHGEIAHVHMYLFEFLVAAHRLALLCPKHLNEVRVPKKHFKSIVKAYAPSTYSQHYYWITSYQMVLLFLAKYISEEISVWKSLDDKILKENCLHIKKHKKNGLLVLNSYWTVSLFILDWIYIKLRTLC